MTIVPFSLHNRQYLILEDVIIVWWAYNQCQIVKQIVIYIESVIFHSMVEMNVITVLTNIFQ